MPLFVSFLFCKNTVFPREWISVTGNWIIEDNVLRCKGTTPSLIYTWSPFPVQKGTLEVVMEVKQRTKSKGWAHAGLMLFRDKNNFWRLGLVENAKGMRYLELIENYKGTWQAQTKSKYRLRFHGSGRKTWNYGQKYLLRLILSDHLLQGWILDYKGKNVIWYREFVLPESTPAIRSGRLGLQTDGLEVSFSRIVVLKREILSRDDNYIGILVDNLPEFDSIFVRELIGSLKNDGDKVIPINVDDLAQIKDNLPPKYKILILPTINSFPAVAIPALTNYLKNGGYLIVIGSRPFEHIVYRINGEWIDRKKRLQTLKPRRFLFKVSPEVLSKSTRSTSNPESHWNSRIVPDSPKNLKKSIRILIEDFKGWDILNLPPFENSPFDVKKGLVSTCFWAKSSRPNQNITVEWREYDGSRWIATIMLDNDWKYYVLTPADFKFWKDGSPKTRGYPEDRFRPENAYRLSFGPAESHGSISCRDFQYWITGVGVTTTSFDLEFMPPKLEMLYPWYKHYQCEGLFNGKATRWQKLVSGDFLIPGLRTITSPIWRPRGLNYRILPRCRWIPVVELLDREGVRRCILASIYFSFEEPFATASWAFIGINPKDLSSKQKEKIVELTTEITKWLKKGIYLVAAGSSQFGYFEDQKIYVGAKIFNKNYEKRRISVKFLIKPQKNDKTLWIWEESLEIGPLEMLTVKHECTKEIKEGEYIIKVELIEGSELIDEISQPMTIVREKEPRNNKLVIVRDGHFWLQGKKWYAHGINFWPLYVSGTEPYQYSQHWLNPVNYDPIVVEENLKVIKNLGMNMISIQYGPISSWHCLIDLLARCERLDLKVNLFISGAHPFQIDEELIKEQITKARLWQWECLFAYDIAWEPRLGNYQNRCHLDSLWREWLIEQYGSIEDAERNWNFKANRNDQNLVTGPFDDQILNDGIWRAMVAAYRRFVDDLISRRLNKVTRFIRQLDPNHLISFRCGWGGTGQPKGDRSMPFDLISGAKHIDFISPEGYGLPIRWDEAQGTGFVTMYARFAGNGKPVFWSEFGKSIYPYKTKELINKQALIWKNMYRVILDSRANGSAGWWFPGGYRVSEKSDFGIVGLDQRLRPSALVAKGYSPKLLSKMNFSPEEIDTYLTIDRDLHPRGFSQVWSRHRKQYLKLRKEGKRIGLRTDGTDKNSINIPLVGVGNTTFDGKCPPKFLNAEFNWVMVNIDRKWVLINPKDTITLPHGTALETKISVGNTGEAEWVAPAVSRGESGAVYLSVMIDNHRVKLFPISDNVLRYEDTILTIIISKEAARAKKIDLRMLAKDRCEFGERFIFWIKSNRTGH